MSVKERLVPGLLVAKAAQNLPQTATATLFTVAGGLVLVTGILGVVTTALGATVTTLSLGVTGSNAALATATAVTSATAGTVYAPTTGAAGAAGTPIVSATPFVSVAEPNFLAPVYVFTTNITWTTSANDTGQMKWYLWYIPIDTSASVS